MLKTGDRFDEIRQTMNDTLVSRRGPQIFDKSVDLINKGFEIRAIGSIEEFQGGGQNRLAYFLGTWQNTQINLELGEIDNGSNSTFSDR
ncbi:hypothetical protein RSOLAG22IIIB_05854 [Rhizoctonia solani]|uniref:Uncharacterized protein n=1 Tax=Rhizoctonia solani TaxID=456999 RepID=A0A0K6GAE1_9AGAM|nr:hypothetical protein RSOLAG22IIIB_05854 [Rhizoctonia solani]